MPATIAKVVEGGEEFQGEAAMKPIPAPNAKRMSVSADMATAPPAIAAQDTADVRLSMPVAAFVPNSSSTACMLIPASRASDFAPIANSSAAWALSSLGRGKGSKHQVASREPPVRRPVESAMPVLHDQARFRREAQMSQTARFANERRSDGLYQRS